MRGKLSTRRMGVYWWIVGDPEFGPYGPYETKAEADEDRRGVQRTLEHLDEPDFFCCSKVTF